ncbi:MAG: hypothetical protein ACYC2G_12850 [Gemmatimonadaceae bacterium]
MCPHSRSRRISALVAAVFGIVTLITGGRILLGLGEAGFPVIQPVLLFNTVMGALYLLAAVLIARNIERGRPLALLIAVANVAVLLAIVGLRAGGGEVANQTIAAMTLRSAVWVIIATVLFRERRLERAAGARA